MAKNEKNVEDDSRVVAIKLSGDYLAALEKYRAALAAKGDPKLTETAAARVLIIDGLRRHGYIKKEI